MPLNLNLYPVIARPMFRTWITLAFVNIRLTILARNPRHANTFISILEKLNKNIRCCLQAYPLEFTKENGCLKILGSATLSANWYSVIFDR